MKQLAAMALELWATAFLFTMLAVGQTNQTPVFLSDDFGISDLNTYVSPSEMEARKRANEARPSELDLEGNWGIVSEGFQLSVRTTKDQFVVGEPIIVAVYFRNTTDQILNYYGNESIDDFEFTVLKGRSTIVPLMVTIQRTTWPKSLTPGQTFNIPVNHDLIRGATPPRHMNGMRQKMYQVQLDEKYVMREADTYVITAKRKIPRLDGAGFTEVHSANAIIRIVDKQKPDDASVKPTQPSPSTKATPSLTGKVPLVSSPNVMGRPATGSVGSAITGTSPGEGSSAGASGDSSKRGVVSTVSRFLTQGGAESSGRWGKIAVLLLFVVIAFLFMRRST